MLDLVDEKGFGGAVITPSNKGTADMRRVSSINNAEAGKLTIPAEANNGAGAYSEADKDIASKIVAGDIYKTHLFVTNITVSNVWVVGVDADKPVIDAVASKNGLNALAEDGVLSKDNVDSFAKGAKDAVASSDNNDSVDDLKKATEITHEDAEGKTIDDLAAYVKDPQNAGKKVSVAARVTDKAGNVAEENLGTFDIAVPPLAAPALTPNEESGDVEITPGANPNAKSMTVEFEGEDGARHAVKAHKDDGGKWVIDEGAEHAYSNGEDGVTIRGGSVKDSSTVTATVSDGVGTSPEGTAVAPALDKILPLNPGEEKNPPRDGYERVALKAGDGVEAFDTKYFDVKKGADLSRLTRPELTAKEGYKDPMWASGPTEETVTGETGEKFSQKVLTATATKRTQAEQGDPVVPGKTKVGDKARLTGEEKAAVKDAVEDANPGTEVTVADDGTATVTYPDGPRDTIPGSSLVSKKMGEDVTATTTTATVVTRRNRLPQTSDPTNLIMVTVAAVAGAFLVLVGMRSRRSKRK